MGLLTIIIGTMLTIFILSLALNNARISDQQALNNFMCCDNNYCTDTYYNGSDCILTMSGTHYKPTNKTEMKTSG